MAGEDVKVPIKAIRTEQVGDGRQALIVELDDNSRAVWYGKLWAPPSVG